MNKAMNGSTKIVMELVASRWGEAVKMTPDHSNALWCIECDRSVLAEVCEWLCRESGYAFACLIVEEEDSRWILRYVFYGAHGSAIILVQFSMDRTRSTVPSISRVVHAADWHERESEDLFGLVFEGHPRLGDFVLHEEWPEGINPMRHDFDANVPFPHREIDPQWNPNGIVKAPGAFMMPIGPVYSDTAESAHFLLETVGEDVIRTIPRFFYKYRGVEKLAEGRSIDHALLLAERFSGTSAFAHSLAFCIAVETICGIDVSSRAAALRILLAEMERLRHHISAISAICASTALAVATSQASILEERALRLTGRLTGHRYLYGLNVPGGVTRDISSDECLKLASDVGEIVEELSVLEKMLRFSSSFLDRIEKVGIVPAEKARVYGLVGPVARASGISSDLRRVLPYAGYEKYEFEVPCEHEGDGYARLRILFEEARQSKNIVDAVARSLPEGDSVYSSFEIRQGASLGWVEAPRGGAFHWVHIGCDHLICRYRITTPSFTNWHGFHLAAEDFAFQDFPIIMATFGLSSAECDR